MDNNGKIISSDLKGKTFTLSDDSNVKIVFKATNVDSKIARCTLYDNSNSVIVNNILSAEKKIVIREKPTLDELGLKGDTTNWKVGPYGIDSGEIYNSNVKEIYLKQNVNSNASYQLSVSNERCIINVYDQNEKLLGTTDNDKLKFNTLADTTAIKISIS